MHEEEKVKKDEKFKNVIRREKMKNEKLGAHCNTVLYGTVERVIKEKEGKNNEAKPVLVVQFISTP